MLYCLFAYAPDAAMLRMVCARLRHLDPEAIIYIISDPEHPVNPAAIPGHVEIHHRMGHTKRGGNLNGLHIVGEEIATYKALMELHGVEHIVKLDADCYPLRWDALCDTTQPGDFVCCERRQAFVPSGMAYTLSLRMANALLELYNARTAGKLWQPGQLWQEDITLWALACQTGLPVRMLPYMGGYAASMPDVLPHEVPQNVLAAHFIHCGEPTADGRRIPREHATLRMRILESTMDEFRRTK